MRWGKPLHLPQLSVRLIDMILPIISIVPDPLLQRLVYMVRELGLVLAARDLARDVGGEDAYERRRGGGRFRVGEEGGNGEAGVLLRGWVERRWRGPGLTSDVYVRRREGDEEDDNVEGGQAAGGVDAGYGVGEALFVGGGDEGAFRVVYTPEGHGVGFGR